MNTFIKVFKTNHRGIDAYMIEYYDSSNPEDVIDFIVVKNIPFGLKDGIKYYLEDSDFKYNKRSLEIFSEHYDFVFSLLNEMTFVNVSEGAFHSYNHKKMRISFKLKSNQPNPKFQIPDYITLADIHKVIEFIGKKFGEVDYEDVIISKNRIELSFPLHRRFNYFFYNSSTVKLDYSL